MAQLRKIEHGVPGGHSGVDGNGATLNSLPKTSAKEVSNCAACRKSIKTTESRVRLEDSVFHLPCFVCTICKKTLTTGIKAFQGPTGRIQCDSCYQISVEKCAKCSEPITDRMFVSQSDAVKYHVKCFRCTTCAAELGEFYEHQGRPYCRDDYLVEVAPVCVQCHKAILPEAARPTSVPQILHKTGAYHPDCFVCDVCEGTLDLPPQTGIATESDRLLSAPHRSSGNTTKTIKQYYPMDGQKLCKGCAKGRAKAKKNGTPAGAAPTESSLTGKSSK